MVDLNEVLVFARVVREGSFTRAAEALGQPKSTVSERVSRLEERLGVRLLERTTRRLRVTPAGAIFYERASRIALEVEEAEAAVTDIHRSVRGLLRIASPLLFGHSFLGDFIGAFLAKHPELEIELTVADRRFDLFEEGLDLAINVFGPPETNLVSRPLGVAERRCVASPGYLRTRGVPPSPRELGEHSCIVFGADRKATWTFSKNDEAIAVAIRGRYAVNSLQLALNAALHGAGVTLLPAIFVAEAVRAGTLVPVLTDYDAGRTELSVVYAGHRHPSARLELFVEALVEAFTKMPPWAVRADGSGVDRNLQLGAS